MWSSLAVSPNKVTMNLEIQRSSLPFHDTEKGISSQFSDNVASPVPDINAGLEKRASAYSNQ